MFILRGKNAACGGIMCAFSEVRFVQFVGTVTVRQVSL